MAIPLTLRIFRDGEALGAREFRRDIIKIGRLSSAHLCLDDERVSRIHAVIEVAGDGTLSVIDMGSAEGTFVNGRRANKATIQAGDEILVGATRLVVEIGSLAEEAPTPAPAEATPAPAGEPVPAPAAVEPPSQAPAAAEVPAPSAPAAAASAPAPAAAAPPAAVSEGAVPIGRIGATAGSAAVAMAPGPAEEEVAETAIVESRPLRLVQPPRPRARKDEGDGPLALEVRVFWGDQALADAMFEAETQVTVGPGKDATFQLEGEHLVGEAFPLLRREGDEWTLRFTDRMDGEVTRKGETVRLRALASRGEARRGDGAYELRLAHDAAAWVDLGNLRADVQFRARPKPAIVPLVERLDFRFLNLLLVTVFVAASAVVAFENFAYDTDLVADDLFSNQARYTRLILKPPPKQNPLIQRLRSLEGPKDPGELAARRKGDEGKMGRKDAPQRNTRSAPRGDPNDKDLVKNQGLLAMLGKGQSGLSTIFGTGGLGGDLKGAIGGITGASVGDAHGFGGLGLKGTGLGGGGVGNTIGVGDVGTKGRGGGLGGYGTGVGGLGRKGTADVSIDSSEAVIMGSLDKELIRRVIQQHRAQIRYCYEAELVRNPRLGGKVAVKFVITADGSVSSAMTAQTTMNNRTVESCINARVKSWQFPKPKGGGIVVVTYPFLFKQSGE